jgi:C1A family cysteine protease
MGKIAYSIFILLILSLFSNLVKAEILCNFSGPDVSQDLLQLTNFTVEGPHRINELKLGDRLRVRFALMGYSNLPINFTDKGVFAAARVKFTENKDFGFTFGKKSLGPEEYVFFNDYITIGEKGYWQIWPSYEIWNGSERKKGPDFWHSCEFEFCPDYCENGISYRNGFVVQDGSCQYSEEECEFGCNEEGTDCANATRLEITNVTVGHIIWDWMCSPEVNIRATTSLIAPCTVYFKELTKDWETKEMTPTSIDRKRYGVVLGNEREKLLKFNTIYQYKIKCCNETFDICEETQIQQFTTLPSALNISNISVEPSINTKIFWITYCDDERAETNYTVYVVNSAYTTFPNPPWSTFKNSTYDYEHEATISGMLEQQKHYTFIIEACSKSGECINSSKHEFGVPLEIVNITPHLTNITENACIDVEVITFVRTVPKIFPTLPSCSAMLPDRFDWRDYNGKNWITPIKVQTCGSCWAHSAVAVMESKYKIENNRDDELDLSEQFYVSCYDGGSCAGRPVENHNESLEFLVEHGTTEESCFPYVGKDICCKEKCSEWRSRLYLPSSYGSVDNSVENIKRALICHGPLQACGWGHCVTVIGWTNDSWIIKNSWGIDWGDNGFGYIPFDASFSWIYHISYLDGIVKNR